MRFVGRLLLFLIVIVVLAVGAMFAVENTTPVPLNLLLFNLEARSVALWVLLAFAVGGVFGMLANIGLYLRLRAQLLRANRQASRAGKVLVPQSSPEQPEEKQLTA